MSGLESIATIAGLTMQSLSAIGQGTAQRSAARAQAQQLDRQAQLMQIEAQRERELAAERAQEKALESSARLSRDIAAGGMSGTLVELGSPSLVTRVSGDLLRDSLFRIRSEGDTRSRMREWTAGATTEESRGMTRAGDNAVWQGLFGAALPWAKQGAKGDFASLRDWWKGIIS